MLRLLQHLTKRSCVNFKLKDEVTVTHRNKTITHGIIRTITSDGVYSIMTRTMDGLEDIYWIKEGDIIAPRLVPPINQTPPQMSARFNEGKTQLREIDSNFILGIGEVLTQSRGKYDELNWQKDTKFSTPYESAMRHLLAYWSGQDYDNESGKHHLLHAATNLMFLFFHSRNNPHMDDRGFKDKK